MEIPCESHRFCETWVMFCRLKLGPQDSLPSHPCHLTLGVPPWAFYMWTVDNRIN